MNEQSNNTRLGDVAYVVRSVEGATAIARGNITNSKIETVDEIHNRLMAYDDIKRERDELREKAERYRLEANAMMLQRDEAREERDILRSNKMSDHLLQTTFKHLNRERDEACEVANGLAKQVERLCKERDEALMDRARGETATMTINHYERILRERDEWKNKAYSHATDYTLMEAKCFRLEQQLKEYDKLKS